MSPKARGLLPAAALVLALVPAPVAASGSNPVCLDAPVSSAVMHPSSCIVTGPVSEVLAGKRQLTRAQISKLAAYFHISPAVFMAEAEPRKNGRTRRQDVRNRF